MSARGALRADSTRAWMDELRRQFDGRAAGRFNMLLDARGLEWDEVGAEDGVAPALHWLRAAGLARAAVVTDAAGPLLAFRRLAMEAELYESQRYLSTAHSPDWERVATRWAAEGVAEPWARQGERRAELAIFLDALGEALMLCDLQGRVLHVNAAMSRLLDADPERAAVMRELERVALSGAGIARGTTRSLDEATRAAARIEREVRTTAGLYRVRRSATGDGICTAAAAQLITLQPLTLQPLSDQELRDRYGVTTREIAVARLLARGQTNAEIAASLGISPFTARNHTEHVLAKLGVPNRGRVAAALCAA
ncbi:MAG: helix-turn-helix transcriptional regulator [Gemmatimonadaceae bacterium]